jgi:membrane protease YdiL (CAAX protease family)
MLFTVKRYFLPTLLLCCFFGSASLLLRHFLMLSWSFAFSATVVIAGLAGVIASDTLLHGLFWLVRRERYLERYRALVCYFEAQGMREIVASGFLAAGEELLFRGILVQGALESLGWSPVPALLLPALLFALLHIIERRQLAPFALWAFWEGVLLGLVYLVSGSVLVSAVVHALHDILGYILFAYQRRTGWLLGETGMLR